MGPITYTFEELVAHKEKGNLPVEALEKLRRDAEEILEKPTVAVTKIDLPRPSGDIHDYVSIAIYRWPNPDTPDGLPWIPKDGVVNPATMSGNQPGNLYGRIKKLALAAFYYPERAEAYAEYANRQLYDWFINPETRMNPNARYAQGIPGICEGRCSGLIDFAIAYVIFDGIGIFEAMGLIDPEILAAVKAWYVEFTDWILTDEYGLMIDRGHDNHATWHDANIMASAFFNDRVALKRNIAITAYENRVKFFIAPNGAQNEELKRTKGMGYSFYNLDAMLIIASLSERLGYKKYWEADAERGVCVIKSAVDFLYPYVIDPESFPYQELHPGTYGSRMARVMLILDKRFPEEKYAERAAKLMSGKEDWLLEPLL